jgi:hypothetical protein
VDLELDRASQLLELAPGRTRVRPLAGVSRMRATCMVSVDPPETTRPLRSHWPPARNSATGLMPAWCQNHLSS